ncbi:MAG TPA: tetratricopeptide repeat protein, partial [Acidimicrobiia bacterium]|nr:tetratricopeptide repeat protein [Acidimicrobiia bacterium]
VARHLQMSGNEAEAAEWYLRAGDLAFQVYAHAETEASYRLAQALGHPDRSRIRRSLAEMYLLTARYREAMAEFEAVAATSEGEVSALALHGIGEVNRRLGRLEAAHHHFEAAVADHPQPARLYADWALLAQRSGQAEEARRMAERSLAEANASDDPSLQARAHHLLGVVSSSTIEARHHYRQALDLAADDPIQRMASLNGLAHVLGHDGDFSAAAALVAQASSLAHRIGDRHREAALLNHLADLHHRNGHRQKAEELVTESVRLFASIEPDAWEPEIWLLTGW